MQRLHIIISGIVQGVFFRMNTCNKAKELKLRGWVRNLETGEVEVVAEGPKDVLLKLARWCGHGPENAQVDDVRISWEAATGSESDFHITDTKNR